MKFTTKLKKIVNKNYQKLAQILGNLNITFKQSLFKKFSEIKVHTALAVPIILYGSEIWTLRKEDKRD